MINRKFENFVIKFSMVMRIGIVVLNALLLFFAVLSPQVPTRVKWLTFGMLILFLAILFGFGRVKMLIDNKVAFLLVGVRSKFLRGLIWLIVGIAEFLLLIGTVAFILMKVLPASVFE